MGGDLLSLDAGVPSWLVAPLVVAPLLPTYMAVGKSLTGAAPVLSPQPKFWISKISGRIWDKILKFGESEIFTPSLEAPGKTNHWRRPCYVAYSRSFQLSKQFSIYYYFPVEAP